MDLIMRNLDLLKTIDQQNISRRAVKTVLSKPRKPPRKLEPENQIDPKTLPVYKVPEFGDRSENYHDFCGQSYDDWKGWEPNSWGY